MPDSSTPPPNPEVPPQHLGTVVYSPDVLIPSLRYSLPGALLTILIPAQYLDYNTPPFEERRLWGTGIYTDDSDITTAIVHAGMYSPVAPHPCDRVRGTPIPRPDHDLEVVLSVHAPLVQYDSSVRNYIGSRPWLSGHHGGAYTIRSVRQIPLGAATYGGALRGRKARMRADALVRSAPVPRSDPIPASSLLP